MTSCLNPMFYNFLIRVSDLARYMLYFCCILFYRMRLIKLDKLKIRSER